jgi:hypothetical protein
MKTELDFFIYLISLWIRHITAKRYSYMFVSKGLMSKYGEYHGWVASNPALYLRTSVSSLEPEDNYPEWCSWFSSVLPDKCQDCTSNEVMTASFQILSDSLSPTVQPFDALHSEQLKVALNKSRVSIMKCIFSKMAFLPYFPKEGLCDILPVCVSPLSLLGNGVSSSMRGGVGLHSKAEPSPVRC